MVDLPGDNAAKKAAEDDLKAAELVHEQVKALWDDQVSFAEGLVDKRKSLVSMLAILVGLGIFRLQLTKRPDEVPAITGIPLCVVKGCLTASLLSFSAAAYFLYTQRPNCRRLLHWGWHSCRRWMVYLWRLARRADVATPVAFPPAPPSPWPSGRVLLIVFPDDEKLDDWFVQTPVGVLRRRTERLRSAYRTMHERNNRVARRLRSGLLLLFMGYGLVLVALGVYLWSIGGWWP